MYGDFPAKNNVCTPYIPIDVWFWPTLITRVQVDLFSLGVCIFELWHPFATEMERVVHLRSLRVDGHMPAAWKVCGCGSCHSYNVWFV